MIEMSAPDKFSPLVFLAALLAPETGNVDLAGHLKSGALKPEALAALASRHRVSPGLWRAVKEKNLTALLPQDFLDYCQEIARLNRQRTEALRAQALELGKSFAAAGLSAVLLKGGAGLFDPPSPAIEERYLVDLDFALLPDQARAARDLMLRQGWTALPNAGGDGHQLPALVKAGGEASVELHFALLSSPYDRLLTIEAVMQEASAISDGILVPSLTHRVIHNIAHAQLADGSLVEGQVELRQLIDFVRLTQLGAVDWSAVAAAFDRQGSLALSLHCHAAHVLLSWRPPSDLSVSGAARFLLARANWLSRHPGFDRAQVFLLRPLRQTVRALASSKNRKRLGKNLASRAWWQRQVKKLKP